MRFENYLSEGRTTPISYEKSVAFIKKNCMNSARMYFNKNVGLFRGHVSITTDFGIVNPKKHERESANTSNFYTLLMDNLPQWKDYPKRGKSLICSNSEEGAYGDSSNKFLVLPVDNAKIGVCSEYDFWESFRNTWPGSGMDFFNNSLEKLLRKYAGGASDTSWAKLKKQIDDADKQSESFDDEFTVISREMNWNEMTLWQYINYVLDPDNNRFLLLKGVNNLPVSSERECWTDAISAVINVNYLSKYGRSLGRDILGE